MPPGTGDVPLTVFQSLPLNGILIVTSPQELVGMIVEKAANMAEMMNIPVLGIIENMSYFKCNECGKEHRIFGESHLEEIADRSGISEIARLPIDPAIAVACDSGNIEELDVPWLDNTVDMLETL
jgi:Mrp family chromosome partitioning ATPase